jgi:hypothetical protein
MVQETVLRLKGIEGLQAPIAICNEDQITSDPLVFVVPNPLNQYKHHPS